MLDVAAEKRLGEFQLTARFLLPAAGVLALFGRSGAGKTTLVNMLAGLVRPDAGRISLAGHLLFDQQTHVDLPPERRRIGCVFQEGRLFPHLDVQGNLLYGRRRAPAGEPGFGFEAIVALLGIDHLLRRRPANLSGGEKQRVAIGRALLSKPRLLLLDEPLAALDAERKAEILPFIEKLRDDLRLPIVYVSHDASEIFRLADRVLILESGRIAASGDVAEVFGRPDLQHLVGESDAGAIVSARLESHDDAFSLSRLRFGGGELLVPRIAARPGAELRLRIRARDVSLALAAPAGLSILNVIPAKVRGVHAAAGAHVDVELDAGAPIWARITARSAHDLGLVEGMPIFAMIKAVSIDRQSVAPQGAREDPIGRT
jgi:molybdate transport system ATP-binding protein